MWTSVMDQLHCRHVEIAGSLKLAAGIVTASPRKQLTNRLVSALDHPVLFP